MTHSNSRLKAAVQSSSPVPAADPAQPSNLPPALPDTAPPSPPVPFLDPIPGVIDFGTVNILAAAAGAGKTTLMAEWCARWQSGRSICGWATNPATGIYYLSTDRGGRSTTKLFEAHGFTEYTYYNLIDDPAFQRRIVRNSAGALDVLRGCVDRLNPIPGAYLFIDPGAPFFVPGSSNDPRAVALFLWELHVIARERQITIFVLAHFGKQSTDANQRYRRPQDRISGSGAWVGFSDTQMFLIEPEPPAQPYHLFGWNPRHSAPQEFKFQRQGPVFVPYHSLEDVGAKHSIPLSTRELFMLIPDAGCSTADLEQAAREFLNMPRSTFFYKLKVLENKGVIERPHGQVRRVSLETVQFVPDGESDDKPN